jgi:hypothetical protein
VEEEKEVAAGVVEGRWEKSAEAIGSKEVT